MMVAGVSPKRGDQPPAHAAPFEPLTPRPGLLKLFSAVFALWVAFLVALYFRTAPTRGPIPPSTQSTTGDAAVGTDGALPSPR